MRKIILNLAVSLDGYIEGPHGEYDWCLTDQDYGMHDFMAKVDTIFFGRKSYELMLYYEKNPYPEHHKYVFSTTLEKAEEHTRLISGDIEKEVQAIKHAEGKDIWLFGGASLTGSLMQAGLVDELQLSVHPLLLGQGKSLFTDHVQGRTQLRLQETLTYSSGLVQLWYEVAQKHG